MRTVRALQIFGLIVIVVVSFFITVPIGEALSSSLYSMSVIALLMLNGVFVLSMLAAEVKKRPYSMTMLHWIFCLFFFVFAPVSQYMTGYFPWGVRPSDEVLLKSCAICIVWTGCFAAGLHWETMQKYLARISKIAHLWGGGSLLRERQALFSAVNIIITLYQLAVHGFSGNLVRGSSVVKTDVSSLSLLFEHCLTAFVSLTTVSASVLMRRDKKCRKFFAVNLMCMLLTYFPTVMSRNGLAGAWGGIFVTMFPKLRKNRKLIFLIIIAVLIIFPMFNAFRHTSFANVNVGSALEYSVRNMPRMWQHGDFDAYTLLTLSVSQTESFGITYGRQLFGTLLFWWPRGFWPPFFPEKTRGSGHDLGEREGFAYVNLSCPLPAEGYMNFGITGVILFGLIFGAIAASIDRSYWRNPDDEYFSVIYPTLIFMFFFMSRGDLMSSLAYTVAFAAVWKLMGAKPILRFRALSAPTRNFPAS